MTTSGTTTWSLDIDEVILEAYDMIGGQPQLGYDGRSARRSLNLLFAEWGNREIYLWTVPSSPSTVAMVSGTYVYTLAQPVIDVMEVVVRTDSVGSTNNTDLPLERLSLGEWLDIPNKEQTGRPTRYMINRQRDQITMTVWPIPDSTSTYTVYFWPFQRIQDVTSPTQTPDAPVRFLPALTAGLAYFLSFKRPNTSPEVVAKVKMRYDEALGFATQEDRERADYKISPKMRSVC